MLTFAAAVFLLMATPGPGVMTAAGVGAAYGFRPGLIYVAGLFIGTNLVAAAVITGLAAVALSVPVIRNVLMVLSGIYLVYLASKIAFAGSKLAFMEAPSSPGVLNGILLQTINPKAYAVNTALFTGFAFWSDNLMAETITKLIILSCIWVPIHLTWLWAGVTLHRLDLAPLVQRRINYGMAGAMLCVVALAILSALSVS